MLTVDLVDLSNKKEIKEFYNLPFKIYKDIPQWVPPLYTDVRAMMNKKKHPFYEHSDADFFIARRGNDVVGRICALENRLFNKYHGTQQAQFYLFECINEQDVANALFEKVFEWARGRSLNEVVGPKGFSLFDGYGIQIEGFEHRQMMIMMNYNPAYYVQLVENLGFQKEVDFVSCYLDGKTFKVPDKVNLVAKRVQEKGTFFVKSFKDKKELSSWADRIGESYNNTFINNWEYYPFTEREVQFQLDAIIMVADPRLIKIILHNGEAVGFLFGFSDISAALQRAGGRLTPWASALCKYSPHNSMPRWKSAGAPSLRIARSASPS